MICYNSLRLVTLRHNSLHYDSLRSVTIRYDSLHFVTIRYITTRYDPLRFVMTLYTSSLFVTLRLVTIRYAFLCPKILTLFFLYLLKNGDYKVRVLGYCKRACQAHNGPDLHCITLRTHSPHTDNRNLSTRMHLLEKRDRQLQDTHHNYTTMALLRWFFFYNLTCTCLSKKEKYIFL